MDQAGNFYGPSPSGGINGNGLVFRLSKKGSGWIFNPLYDFLGGYYGGGDDGSAPYAGVIFGPDGSLYGTTYFGGGVEYCDQGCGTVFSLKPYPTACKTAVCGWQETVLYRFTGDSDGLNPTAGVIFDQVGNLYGITSWGFGGDNKGGTVWELTPSGSGWTESTLYSFSGGNDGGGPSGLTFDNAGNLYGTTNGGGTYSAGTVFQLTPSGSGWTEKILYSFQGGNDGGIPVAGVIFDPSGNLYGTTSGGGQGGGGTVFKLTPSNGSWTFSLVYSFISNGGGGPGANLVMDAAGNLYGTTVNGGSGNCSNGCGTVFKLMPSGGSWTYNLLHEFTGGSDGAFPVCEVVFDANGNLYGTASQGALTGCQYYPGGCGTVWEITP